jgi:peroxiredoxin
MKNTKQFKIIMAMGLISLALFSFLKPTASEPYEIGDQINDFTLSNIDGSAVSLSDYNNQKGVILIFTCNTCPYAVAYEDRIIALHKNYENAGYPVLAINPNDPAAQPGDSMDEMKKRAKEKGFDFAYLQDKGQQIYPLFGATKTPHVFLLNNENGSFILEYIGAIDDNYKDATKVEQLFLEDAIKALQNGNEIELKETKAIGCSIKSV